MTTRSDTEGLLREAAQWLADRAAGAVTEPRLFLEDAERQHTLGQAVAIVRTALRATPPDTDPSGLGDATGWRTGASWESNPAFVQALDDYNEVEHQDAAERHFWVERYDAIIEAAIHESRAGGGLDVEGVVAELVGAEASVAEGVKRLHRATDTLAAIAAAYAKHTGSS